MNGLSADFQRPPWRPDAPPLIDVPADPVAERLWRRWRLGERPDVLAFVGACGAVPADSLLAVLEVDQRERWQAGERAAAETYLLKFPQLTSDPRAFSLVLTEMQLRHSAGDPALLDDYRRRFPEFARQLGLMTEPAAPTPVAAVGDDPQTLCLATTQPVDDIVLAGLPPGEPGDTPQVHRIGPYEVVGVLAKGGMGIVYRAVDTQLKRTVALKMILSGASANAETFARFRAEAEAVARLQHPNIVQIYQVGEHDGLPYLALEYVDGRNLHQVAAKAPLTPPVAADVMRTVARAVDFAHQRGIIHRDLKPGNILLEEQRAEGGERRAEDKDRAQSPALGPPLFTPKITDFGVAKLYKDADSAARPGEVIGTPNYMAPEQAEGRPDGVGPAADVYSLGAVLYELLTGEPPFHGASPMETLMRVRLSKLVPPRYYAPHVPPDLETICLKCLNKDRRERYATAAAVAEDLDRFLAGRPIAARPVGRPEQAWKWGRRHPAVAALAAALAVVLVVTNALVVYQWRNAVAAREDAGDKLSALREMQRLEGIALRETQAARAVAERKQYAMQLLAAETEWLRFDAATARRMLHACRPERRGWEWYYLDRLFQGSEVTVAPASVCVALHALSDNKQFIAIGSDGALAVWDLASGRLVRGRELARDETVPRGWVCHRAAFSRDGGRVAAVVQPPPGAPPAARAGVWDVATGQLIRSWACGAGVPMQLAFSPDAQLLAWVSGAWVPVRGTDSGEWRGGEARVVNVADGRTRFEKPVAADGHSFLDAAFSAGGDRLALTRRGQGLIVVDAATGVETLRAGEGLEGQRVWWLPKAAGFAVLCGHELHFLDAAGKPAHVISRRTAGIERVFFSPDGERFVCANAFNTVRVYDTATRREMFQLAGHTNWVSLAVVTPDNRRLVTCGLDNTVKVWNLDEGRDPPALGDGEYAEGTWIPALAFDRTGGRLFAGSDDRNLRAFDPAARTKAAEWPLGEVRSLTLSPDGKTLAVGFDEKAGRLGFFDPASGTMGRTFKAHDDSVTQVAFSADGARLASASEDGTAKVWDAATGALLATCKGHTGYVHGVAFLPDSRQIVTAGKDGTVRFWDAATGAEMRVIKAHRSPVTCVAVSPDGRLLATGNENRDRRDVPTEIRVWDACTGEMLHAMTGHTNSIWHLAFSPDGRRLASAGEDTTVKIWDPADGDLLLSLKQHFDDVRALAFSRDGHRLASSGDDPFLRVWDATPLP